LEQAGPKKIPAKTPAADAISHHLKTCSKIKDFKLDISLYKKYSWRLFRSHRLSYLTACTCERGGQMNDYSHPIHRKARHWRQAHLRLPDDLHQRLEQKAKASERTLAGEMRLRLEHSLAREDGEGGKL
jgi:hypothetical protein